MALSSNDSIYSVISNDSFPQTVLFEWRIIHNFMRADGTFWRNTHWGGVTHICVGNGSDNGLSPSRHQAIIWTDTGILLIRTLGTNFSEILSEIHIFSFKKMHLKMSSAKWRQFCLGLNMLTKTFWTTTDEHIFINAKYVDKAARYQS